MKVKKIVLLAVFTAFALGLFIVEAQIPLIVPIPGAKLGLANVVTLFALFFSADSERGAASFTTADAFMMLICRIILGALLTGRVAAFIYSVAGGLLGFAAQAAVKRFVTDRQIWVCGAVGAVFHNIGQILAAMVLTGTPSIVAYLPLLLIAGVATGVVTGLAAQFAIARIGVALK